MKVLVKTLLTMLFGVVLLFTAVSFRAAAAGLEMPPDIQACNIVSGEEVARLAGGKLLVKPGSTSFFCNYVVEREDGGVESYQLTFDSASSTALLMEHRNPTEKWEKIDGILDEAYLGRSSMTEQFQFQALLRSKLGLNVTGDRKEVVLQIARLAASRLP